jgi:hypothetical protein
LQEELYKVARGEVDDDDVRATVERLKDLSTSAMFSLDKAEAEAAYDTHIYGGGADLNSSVWHSTRSSQRYHGIEGG